MFIVQKPFTFLSSVRSATCHRFYCAPNGASGPYKDHWFYKRLAPMERKPLQLTFDSQSLLHGMIRRGEVHSGEV